MTQRIAVLILDPYPNAVRSQRLLTVICGEKVIPYETLVSDPPSEIKRAIRLDIGLITGQNQESLVLCAKNGTNLTSMVLSALKREISDKLSIEIQGCIVLVDSNNLDSSSWLSSDALTNLEQIKYDLEALNEIYASLPLIVATTGGQISDSLFRSKLALKEDM